MMMPKQPRRAVGHSAVQVFPGKVLDAKTFEVPGGLVGSKRLLVGVTFVCGDALLTGRHEPRPIRYGQETPDVIQMIFPIELLEELIGALAYLRDATPDNLHAQLCGPHARSLAVAAPEAPQALVSPATEATE